jgi:hypothetical protein
VCGEMWCGAVGGEMWCGAVGGEMWCGIMWYIVVWCSKLKCGVVCEIGSIVCIISTHFQMLWNT